MIIKTKNEKILEKYEEKIKNIKELCDNSKLRIAHKKRFNYFFDRAGNYCDNHKAINYQRVDRSYKNEPYNKKQKIVYEQILDRILKLQKEILEDNELKTKYKQQLCKCLSYSVGHLRGRLTKK